MVNLISTKDGSKSIIPSKDVPFGGINDVPKIWGVKSTKLKFLAHEYDFQA